MDCGGSYHNQYHVYSSIMISITHRAVRPNEFHIALTAMAHPDIAFSGNRILQPHHPLSPFPASPIRKASLAYSAYISVIGYRNHPNRGVQT